MWCRVLQGKYERGSLEAGHIQIKATDSALWKAIGNCWNDLNSMEAWALGNGSSINLWKDKWINESLRLVDHAASIPHDALNWCVSDIVNEERNWNMDALLNILPSGLLQKISAIPAPLPHDGPDERYWPGEGSGKFVVSLAYKHLCNLDQSLRLDCWEKLWKLQVPERIRCFIWQLFDGKLATKEYCGRWGNGDVFCRNCRNSTETIIHVLRDCPLAASFWNSFIPSDFRSDFYGVGLIEWLNGNLFNCTKLEVVLQWCEVWATGCYYLWFWRNKEAHDEEYTRLLFPSRLVTQYAMEYERSRHRSLVPNRATQQVLVRWIPPAAGWVAINTDGAFRATSAAAGCGGVVRDSLGHWMGGFARRLHVTSAYLAELWGAMDGINLAASNGYTSIELQMDSAVVVNCLNGSGEGSIAGRSLVRRIKQLLSCFTNVRIRHIYREANKVADELANLGCTYTEGSVYFDSPPTIVNLLVNADVIGVSTPHLILV